MLVSSVVPSNSNILLEPVFVLIVEKPHIICLSFNGDFNIFAQIQEILFDSFLFTVFTPNIVPDE